MSLRLDVHESRTRSLRATEISWRADVIQAVDALHANSKHRVKCAQLHALAPANARSSLSLRVTSTTYATDHALSASRTHAPHARTRQTKAASSLYLPSLRRSSPFLIAAMIFDEKVTKTWCLRLSSILYLPPASGLLPEAVAEREVLEELLQVLLNEPRVDLVHVLVEVDVADAILGADLLADAELRAVHRKVASGACYCPTRPSSCCRTCRHRRRSPSSSHTCSHRRLGPSIRRRSRSPSSWRTPRARGRRAACAARSRACTPPPPPPPPSSPAGRCSRRPMQRPRRAAPPASSARTPSSSPCPSRSPHTPCAAPCPSRSPHTPCSPPWPSRSRRTPSSPPCSPPCPSRSPHTPCASPCPSRSPQIHPRRLALLALLMRLARRLALLALAVSLLRLGSCRLALGFATHLKVGLRPPFSRQLRRRQGTTEPVKW